MSRATFGYKKKKNFLKTQEVITTNRYNGYKHREGLGQDEAGVQGTLEYEVLFLDPGGDHKGICLVLKL